MLKNAFYIALFALISWGSYQLSYPSNTSAKLTYEGVFFENVIDHIDQLTRGPRAVGDYFHDDVQRYLIKQLNDMGLKVSIQKTTSFNPKQKSAAPIRNIIAKYPGTDQQSKSLMLLAHYDAAKYIGKGAGDDASGVATILETINALIKSKQQVKNNIVVLITDGEELGLLGARAFINEQIQNSNIGLIINLEARGSSGPNMMWPETVGGNRAMIEAFSDADIPLPVTTSLHYEIYKLLPNDTDLSPFNQISKINGFNFAFIDDYFNYHTELDSLDRLSINTLAHQTIQMHKMLQHFANIDLDQLYSDESMVYFTIPMLGLISYSTNITWWLLGVFSLLLIGLIYRSVVQGQVTLKSTGIGTLPVIIASILVYGWCWLILKLIYLWFPEFNDVLQGFPYQGHHIMAGLLISAAVIAMAVFGLSNRENHLNRSVANVLLWLILLIPMIYYLPGSGLLIWPLLFSITLLGIELYMPKFAEQLAPLFAAVGFLIIGTLLINFPIALGIKATAITAVILVWNLGLFTQVISQFKKVYHALFLLALPLIYLLVALVYQPSISEQYPLPTSLSYLYDTDTEEGYYFNYDVVNTEWNSSLFSNSAHKEAKRQFRQAYLKPVKNLASAEPNIPLKPININAQRPLKPGENQIIEITLTAESNARVLELFTQNSLTIYKMSIEGRNAIFDQTLHLDPDELILKYYFGAKKEIKLILEIGLNEQLNWQVQTHSLDLLERSDFSLDKRPKELIKKAFIKTDNAVVVQSFAFGLDQ